MLNELDVKTVLVETRKLTKSYGDFTALKDCNLQVQPGIVCGLLGPNGAGKTTLLRLIMGFLFPTEGKAWVAGFDCHRQTVEAHRRISYLPGDAQLFGSMRGRKVLQFFSRVRADCDFQRALELADRLNLDIRRRVAFMSTGMRQKLALCVALGSQAELTILDEPTANLDPTVRAEVIRIIGDLRHQGKTVIFSSHVMSEIEDVCDRVVMMRGGRIVRDLDMHELKSRHRVSAVPTSQLDPVPESLKDRVGIRLESDRVTIDISGDLGPVLKWLTKQPLKQLKVEGVGLRSIYDQHHANEVEPIRVDPRGTFAEPSPGDNAVKS